MSKKTLLNNKTYVQNQKQIECISNTLVEHADVPQQLIDWLIQSVRENTIIECEK